MIPLLLGLLLHVLYYTTAIVEYHEIVSHNTNPICFIRARLRAVTSRKKNQSVLCNLCFHEMTVVIKVQTEE